MPAHRPHTDTSPLRFGRMAPTIAVADMARALDFYTRILGFHTSFENGSPVGFAILVKDAAELHLSLHPGHQGSGQNVAHLLVEDANAFHAHCEAHGVRIVKALRDADFGLRCFVLADPDGNRIDVGQPMPADEPR